MGLVSFFADYGIFGIFAFIILFPYVFRFIYEKNRDRKFIALATQYNLKATLNYRGYPYREIIRSGEIYILRMLEGSRDGKTLLIQDRMKPLVYVSNRLFPVYFWIFLYSGLPTFIFGYGIETIRSVNGTEKDISSKRFLSVISYASATDVETAIKSL